MKKKLIIIFLILFGFFIYLLTLRGVWGDAKPNTPNIARETMPMESSHERAPYTMMLSIVEDHRFNISKEYANFASPDVGIYHGKFYSYFPPAVSVWIIPFYLLGQFFNLGQVMAFYSMGIFSVLTIVFIYLTSKNIFKLPESLSMFNGLVFGFASTFWSYSTTIYQHSMTAFLLIFSFYAAWKYSTSEKNNWFWASLVWISYGVGTFVDYPNIVILFPVIIYFLIKSVKVENHFRIYNVKLKLSLFVTSVLFLIIGLIHGYYNYVNFGSLKTVSNILPMYNVSQLKNKNAPIDIVEKANQKTDSFKLLTEDRIVNGLYELAIAPDKGILFFSPIFVISLFGIILSFKKRTLESKTLLGIAIINLLFYASFDASGGWAFGARYAIPSMVILSIFVGIAINYFKYLGWFMRILAFLLFSISSAIALLGALTTNLVAPKGEAIFLKIKYSYIYNVDFILDGRTGSFVYKNYFLHNISLLQYYEIILFIVLIVVFSILFLFPLVNKIPKFRLRK